MEFPHTTIHLRPRVTDVYVIVDRNLESVIRVERMGQASGTF